MCPFLYLIVRQQCSHYLHTSDWRKSWYWTWGIDECMDCAWIIGKFVYYARNISYFDVACVLQCSSSYFQNAFNVKVEITWTDSESSSNFLLFHQERKTLTKSFLNTRKNLWKSGFIYMQYFTILKHLLKLSYMLIFRNNFEKHAMVSAWNWTNSEKKKLKTLWLLKPIITRDSY